MRNVTGLGGAFIMSENPMQLADWYRNHLGFKFEGDEEFGAYYEMFWAIDPEDAGNRLDTTFAIMRAKRPLARPKPNDDPDDMYGDQHFMVNIRVRDLDALIAELSDAGIEPLKRQDESYGRFAWVRDLDGNRVELYQPLPPPAEG